MGPLEGVLLVPCLGTHDGVAPGVVVDTQLFWSDDDDDDDEVLLSLSNGGVDVEVLSLFSSNIGVDEDVLTPFSSVEDELLSAVPCRGRNGVIFFWVTDVVVFCFCHSSPLFRWIFFGGHSCCSSIILFSGRGTSSPLSREKNGVFFFSFPGVFFFHFC